SRSPRLISKSVDDTTSPSQLSAADMLQAEKMLFQRVQADSFAEELKFLKRSQPMPRSSRIAALAPVLDKDGLIRLYSRIKFAPGVDESVLLQDKEVTLYNKQTDWDSFRDIVDDTLKLKVALKSSGDVDNATMQFTNTIQTTCWRLTPQKSEYGMRLKNVPGEIRKRIQEKRRLRRVWHTSRCPSDKTALNKAMFELKTMIKDTEDE
ncbi:Uncharacterized protein OBRU01_24153, partial [Operophtera brumata]